jgi:putative proteasome-type protease
MLDKGMIFASDSRTNAGVDNFAKFCKMTVFERRGDRVIVLLSSGNLAGTQAVISILTQRCADGDAVTNLWLRPRNWAAQGHSDTRPSRVRTSPPPHRRR